MAADDPDLSTIDDPFSLDREQRQHEVVAPGRSTLGIVVSVVAVVGLGYAALTGGSTEPDGGVPEPVPDSGVVDDGLSDVADPTPAVDGDVVDGLLTISEPRIEGQLADGAAFEVRERMPGVLCAVVPGPSAALDRAGSADVIERCHHELVTGSGAAVLDAGLIFGYLRPGAASASLRYRAGPTDDEGLRVEPSAGFFALPIQGDDPYRLQYRSSDEEVVEEVPLVPLSGGPSQSGDDAGRDGVPTEIAALPFNRRVVPLSEWPSPSTGPLVWSRIDRQWSEVLLLDDTGTRILGSTPLHDLRIRSSVSTADALFLIGDQILGPVQLAVDRAEPSFPVAVVRIDHATGESVVRLFPQPPNGGEATIEPVLSQPDWLIGPIDLNLLADRITFADGSLQLTSSAQRADGPGVVLLDPDTLLPR